MLKTKVYSSNFTVTDGEKLFDFRWDYDYYLCLFCPLADEEHPDNDVWEDENEAIEQCEFDIVETLREEFPNATDEEIKDATSRIMVYLRSGIRNAWHFGAVLKQWRIKSGKSQKAFAMMLGVPLRTYENWEWNDRTPPEYVQKLILNEIKRKRENG